MVGPTEEPSGSPATAPGLTTGVRTFFALVPDESVRRQFVALARDVARRSRGRADFRRARPPHAGVPGRRARGEPAVPLRAIGDALPHRGGDARLRRARRMACVRCGMDCARRSCRRRSRSCTRRLQRGAGRSPVRAREPRLSVRTSRSRAAASSRIRAAHARPSAGAVDRLCLIGSELAPGRAASYDRSPSGTLRVSRTRPGRTRSGPVATGRDGSAHHSLHEPG